jgi:hypothetical protein
MKIDFHLLVQRTSIAGEDQGWVYGNLKSMVKESTIAPAVLATRPWLRTCEVVPSETALNAVCDVANLKLQETQQAIAFLRVYGLFSAHECLPLNIHSERIKNYWRECKRSGKTPFATELSTFWFHQQRIRTALAIGRSIPKDLDSLRQACRVLGIQLRIRRADDVCALTRDVLSHLIGFGLAQTSLGVIPYRKKMVAAAITSDVRSLLYTGLLIYVTRGVPLKECANSSCRKIFLVTRSDRRFCDLRCQNLIKVKRFRERKRKRVGSSGDIA